MQPILEYYRCPSEFLDFHLMEALTEATGSFRFAEDAIRYGQLSGYPQAIGNGHVGDVSQQVSTPGRTGALPFDLSQVVDHLRYERYLDPSCQQRWSKTPWIRDLYYLLRPWLPATLRRQLQKIYLHGWNRIPFPQWPLDRSVDRLFEQLLLFVMQARHMNRLPFIWFWPEGHTACAMVTHDVETAVGRDFTSRLMDIDDSFGIKSSFQIVPEVRYGVPETYLDTIRERGFEIGMQGLSHDGWLFQNRDEFLRRAAKINHYARQVGAQGFRSPSTYRNVDWFRYLHFAYDMTVSNVAHLEPQRGGCCTVMPYFLPGGMLELPLTTIQDYSLFAILGDYSTTLWQEQCRRILEGYGLMSFLVHPDYIQAERAQNVYKSLLAHVNRLRTDHGLWVALPSDVNRWWRERSHMRLVPAGDAWRIEGPGSHRARVAYARVYEKRLIYELDGQRSILPTCR